MAVVVSAATRNQLHPLLPPIKDLRLCNLPDASCSYHVLTMLFLMSCIYSCLKPQEELGHACAATT
jgi:hypothetical protein